MSTCAAFKAALVRIGFNTLTADEIIINGFDNISVLGEVEEKDIDELVRHIGRWRGPRVATSDASGDLIIPPPQQITLPFLSIGKLKAMRAWVLKKMRQDIPFVAAECTNTEIRTMIARQRFIQAHATSTAAAAPVKHKPLKSFANWRKFKESWETYTFQMYGAMGIPMMYVQRFHTDVTPEMLLATYENTDEEFMCTFKLEGEAWNADNGTYWNELKPLIIDGPGWTYIKPFGARKDGRGAIIALTMQAEGSAALKQRKSAAYSSITSARFRGATRNYTLDSYIELHASAHAELLECKEPVSETKKVSDFRAGISCPKLEMAKAHVLGMDSLNEEFAPCQNYIKTYHLNVKENDKITRNVSMADSDPPARSRAKKQHVKSKNSLAFSNKEWNALSDADKEHIKQKRKALKSGKRAAAAVATEDGEVEDTPPNAGTQFGKNAHKKSKN